MYSFDNKIFQDLLRNIQKNVNINQLKSIDKSIVEIFGEHVNMFSSLEIEDCFLGKNPEISLRMLEICERYYNVTGVEYRPEQFEFIKRTGIDIAPVLLMMLMHHKTWKNAHIATQEFYPLNYRNNLSFRVYNVRNIGEINFQNYELDITSTQMFVTGTDVFVKKIPETLCNLIKGEHLDRVIESQLLKDLPITIEDACCAEQATILKIRYNEPKRKIFEFCQEEIRSRRA